MSSAAGVGVGSGVVATGGADRSSPATSGASAASAVGSSSGAKVAAPTLAERAPSSIVRARVIRWLNSPLLRSVNWTPARISAAASSTVRRVCSVLPVAPE